MQTHNIVIPIQTPYDKFKEDDDWTITSGSRPNTKNITELIGIWPIVGKDSSLQAIQFSDQEEPVELKDTIQLVDYLFENYGNTTTFTIYNKAHLDILLKSLDRPLLRNLDRDKFVSTGSIVIHYIPKISITFTKHQKSRKINCISSWTMRLKAEEAYSRIGIPFIKDDPKSEVLAVETLGVEILKRLSQQVRLPFTYLANPARYAKKVLDRETAGRSLQGVPSEIVDMCLYYATPQWVEALALGHYSDTRDYDLNSAYPNEVKRLLKISSDCGEWIESKEKPEGAAYGFLWGLLSVHRRSHGVSPFIYRASNQTLHSPYGVWQTLLFHEEVDFLYEHNLGTFTADMGWWFVPSKEIYPYEKSVTKLLTTRQESDDILLKSMMKSVGGRICGQFLEAHFTEEDGVPVGPVKAGVYFNPIYYMIVTARTRLKLARYIYQAIAKGGRIFSVAVDGFLTDVQIEEDEHIKLAHQGEAIIANSRTYYIEGKDSRLHLKEVLERNLDASELIFDEHYHLTLKEGLKSDRLHLVGTIDRKKAPRVYINNPGSRRWPSKPKIANDLLTNQYHSYQNNVVEFLRK